jgi:D-3-phosphoglycerate dehydrogenase
MRVLVSENLAEEGLERMRQSLEVDYRPRLSPEELLEIIPYYDALVVRSATRVTREVISHASRLKVIGRAGVGVDNVDLEAATERGIAVLNVPDGNVIAACEHTFALMLALARQIPDAVLSLRQGKWERQRFLGRELYRKTLGIVGLGRIGSEVARRARAFGMEVIAYDPFVSPARAQKLGVEVMSLEELLPRADFLTLHVPLTPQTRSLIGREELFRLKRGAFLVNTSRGGVVDEEALYQALAEGHLGGAALDVFEREPPGDHPLLRLPNFVATPHLGASTVEAQVTCAVEIAEQVVQCLLQGVVRNAVNLPPVSPETWEEISPLLPLGECLGRIFIQALGGPIEEVEVSFRGEMEEKALDLVAHAALAGLLSGITDRPVNQVNAPVIARQKGITLKVTRSGDGQARVPFLELRAGRHSVSGYLTPHGQMRLLEVDGLPLDMAPAEHMLFDFHQDRPGIIGRVGTILGEHGINIAAMSVGRREARGEAVMVLAVDDPVPAEVLDKLRGIPGVHQFRAVSLPPALLKPWVSEFVSG